MRITSPLLLLTVASLTLAPLACTTDGEGDELADSTESGDGDGDGDAAGDGDGDDDSDEVGTDSDTEDTDDSAGTDTDDSAGTDTDDSAGTDTDDTAGTDTDDTDTDDSDGTDTGAAECGMDPGWGQVAIGQPVKHVQAKNYDGTPVNLCEWAGTPIALDAAAVWCGPCQLASEFLSTGMGQDPFSGLGPALKTAVDGGNILWVTALLESGDGSPGTIADGSAWDEAYPNPNIPVITEDDVPMLSGYLPGNCVPRVFVIDEGLNFWALDDCASWNHLSDMLNEWG